MSNYMESTFGAMRWELLKTIEQEIHKVDGTIFGGYVSDTIIHNHYAEAFYKAKEEFYENEIDQAVDRIMEGEQPDTKNLGPWSYTNPECHPVSWPHRTRQPEDIDCVIHPARLQHFVSNMRSAGIDVTQLFRQNARFYLPLADRHHIEHSRLAVTIAIPWKFSKYMVLPKIHLDVILDPDYMMGKTAIPYGEPDFECNRIILTKNGYAIHGITHPMRKLERLQKIIRDILDFRAVPQKAQQYRMVRMMDKGYHIEGLNYIVTKNLTTTDGHCLHCLEEFEPMDFSVKNNCCQARYHIRCYTETQRQCTVQYNNVDFCALCRSEMKKPEDLVT